ncbi:MAG: SAM-dependent chlorinase/fluorinase [Actinobacteria bacterium]|nr:SAM-dependent chlorinase/fluorinase [Actinomycetota bacterium]
MSDAPDVAARRYNAITVMSDLGTADGYVGVLHSIMRQLAPGVEIVDLTHDIPACDIQAGALVLARSVQYLCPGVIIGAVDPGVGSGQRPVALEVAGGAAVLVGPDNGVLASAVGMISGADRAFVLDNTDFHIGGGAATFATRDIFAPVAAHLCAGATLEDVGTEIDPNSLLPGLVPLNNVDVGEDGTPFVEAEVLWVDRFGNVQLNVDPDDIAGWPEAVQLDASGVPRTLVRVATFSQLQTSQIGLLVDSDGLLTVAMYARSAAEELSLHRGDGIRISPLEDDTPRTSVSLGPTRRTGGE